MTGYRRAYRRSRVPRRYVPWSEKVFYLEQSKRKVQVEAKWRGEVFFGVKDESEIAVVGTPHGIVVHARVRLCLFYYMCNSTPHHHLCFYRTFHVRC